METNLQGTSLFHPNLGWLTQKEKQVLWFTASGLNSKAIAIRLNVLPKSIDNYKNRIGKKLGLKGYGTLIGFAQANKIHLMAEEPEFFRIGK